MYYIKDLYENRFYGCDTVEQLIRTYRSFDYRFHDLNVTGKDIYYVPDPRTGEPMYFLRRYQVFDEEFRSIDIRDLEIDPHKAIPGSVHSSIYLSGRKRHHCTAHGTSFWRGDARNRCAINDSDDNEYECVLPRVRAKAIVSVYDNWDHYEKKFTKYFHGNRMKSWKDQRKTRHQYEKRKVACYTVQHDKRDIPDDIDDAA